MDTQVLTVERKQPLVQSKETRAEFESMITRLAYSLKPFAMSLTRDIEDAHDLIHETVLRALTSNPISLEGTNVKGWLYTIMRNIFINNYRRNKRRSALVDTTEDMYAIDSLVVNKDVNKGESNMEMQTIKKALAELGEDFRKPFMMYFEGYKYKEIADNMALPIGTVKSRIHFARKALKLKLSRY